MKKIIGSILLFINLCCSCPSAAEDNDAPARAREDFGTFNIFSKRDDSLRLTLESAIESGLSNNIALSVEKLKPQLAKSDMEIEQSRFDKSVDAEVSFADRLGKTRASSGNLNDSAANTTSAEISLSDLSTSGTRTSLGLGIDRSRSATSGNLFATRLGVSIEHPLWQGAGKKINLISLRKAELDLDLSDFEVNAYVMNLAAQIEKRYWQYYLMLKELDIVRESLELANQQRDETMKRIEAGSIPESEAAAADAEVALRQEGVINAESRAVVNAVSLLRSINPDSGEYWKLRPELVDKPVLQQPDLLDLEEHIRLALASRPELAQARLLLEKDKLDIVYSENGVLPKLDFFMTLGKTGYARSFADSSSKISGKDSYDISAGFIYDLTRGRRAAKAELSKAQTSAVMSREAIKNLEQLIIEDVINAYIEVKRTIQQLTATAATSQKQLEKLRVEEVKFNVGKTTSFQVAQAQRDLTAAKIAEVKSAVDFTTAVTELLRADGSLLQRHGIVTATSR